MGCSTYCITKTEYSNGSQCARIRIPFGNPEYAMISASSFLTDLPLDGGHCISNFRDKYGHPCTSSRAHHS